MFRKLIRNDDIQRRSRFLAHVVWGFAASGLATAAFAQAGDPLPRCEASENAFYLLRYSGPAGSDRSVVALNKVEIATPGSTATEATPQWSGVNPSTVAAGMRPQDGYIYALRSSSEDSYDSPQVPPGGAHDYSNDHRGLQIIRYGTAGAENLGQIVDGPGIPAGTAIRFTLQGLSNHNAADINPATGELIAGNVRQGNYLSGSNQLGRLLRIDVTTNPPQLLGFIDLNPPIPNGASGDFAIDAAGTFAYGIARPSGGPSTWWKADLQSGVVTTVALDNSHPPYGGAAQLFSGEVAFYSNTGRVAVFDTNGVQAATYDIGPSESSDAARCLPPAPPPPPPASVQAVPTLGEWALILLSLMMSCVFLLRRKMRP